MHILRIFVVCLGVTSYISCASDDEGIAVLTANMLQLLRKQQAPAGVIVMQILADANIYTVKDESGTCIYKCVVGEEIESARSSLMNGKKIPHQNNPAYQAFLKCYQAAKAQQ